MKLYKRSTAIKQWITNRMLEVVFFAGYVVCVIIILCVLGGAKWIG